MKSSDKGLLLQKIKNQRSFYTMIFPAVVILLVYAYAPLSGWAIAFQYYKIGQGFLGSEWIGLENFRYIFDLPNFGNVLYNTIFIALGKMFLGIFVPVIIAILLNEMASLKIARGIQIAIYLPHFLSWVILAGIMIEILSPTEGIINVLLNRMGQESIYFLGDKKVFPFVLIFSDIWKEFGFGTIIYMAALAGVDPNLNEAAAIDGAGRFRRIYNISIPAILPIIVVIGTLRLGSVLNAGFEQVFNLYNPLVYETGDILDTLVYRIGLVDYQFDVATAIGVFKSGISLVMVSTSYLLAYKFLDYKIF